MAEKYYQNSIYSSTKPKDNNGTGGGQPQYEDAASFHQQQQPGRTRSVISARTGASMYSQVTKKSSEFFRTDVGSLDRKVPLSQRISKFIWNPEDRTFLDRGGLAWARLIIFYIAFYTIIALIWAACFALFDFAVLNEDRPVLSGEQNVLRLNPSLSYIPQPDYYTSLIRYRNSRFSSARKYIDDLVAFTQWYEEYGQQNILSANEQTRDCSADGKNPDPMNFVCRFNLDVGRRCNAYVNFGFVDGDPCIVLKLNRVYGWVPDPVDEGISSNASNTGVLVKCQGRTPTDRDFIKQICYHYTSNGWDGTDGYCKEGYGVFEQYFFPYLKQVRYMSPLVFVEFKGITRNVVTMIECWAEAKNIKLDRTYRIGMVQFEILID